MENGNKITNKEDIYKYFNCDKQSKNIILDFKDYDYSGLTDMSDLFSNSNLEKIQIKNFSRV